MNLPPKRHVRPAGRRLSTAQQLEQEARATLNDPNAAPLMKSAARDLLKRAREMRREDLRLALVKR
jgi:hypothetical protein